MNRLRADVEPELVIARVVGGDGVETIGSQFAEDRQRARIRQRSSREAVRGSSDNQRGREALRLPHRMRCHARCRRVGREDEEFSAMMDVLDISLGEKSRKDDLLQGETQAGKAKT